MEKYPFRHKRLGYAVLNVTDIERSTDFAVNVIGLDAAGQGANGERFFRCTPNHHDVVLCPAGEAAFVRSGWQVETPDELDRAYAHYDTLGWKPAWLSREECQNFGVERMFRVREPSYGICFEYYDRMIYISSPLTNHLTSFYGQGHIGIGVPDTRKLHDCLTRYMGFATSDILGPYLGTLLRAWPNPNHHSVGVLPSSTGKADCHHIAFMVNSIDDIGKFINRAKRMGVKAQFGIGRHPTSGSIHYYVYDPDWFIWEYTLGMEQFPELNPREPRYMSPAPENYDLWGAVPDREFAGRNPLVLTS